MIAVKDNHCGTFPPHAVDYFADTRFFLMFVQIWGFYKRKQLKEKADLSLNGISPLHEGFIWC